MSDLLFGWVLGLMTITFPYLLWQIAKLKRQLSIFAKPMKEIPGEEHKKRKGLFGKVLGLFD